MTGSPQNHSSSAPASVQQTDAESKDISGEEKKLPKPTEWAWKRKVLQENIHLHEGCMPAALTSNPHNFFRSIHIYQPPLLFARRAIKEIFSTKRLREGPPAGGRADGAPLNGFGAYMRACPLSSAAPKPLRRGQSGFSTQSARPPRPSRIRRKPATLSRATPFCEAVSVCVPPHNSQSLYHRASARQLGGGMRRFSGSGEEAEAPEEKLW